MPNQSAPSSNLLASRHPQTRSGRRQQVTESVTIHELERYAPQWANLMPDDPKAQAAVADLLARKYTFSYEALPAIRQALGLDSQAVKQAYQSQYHQPLATLFRVDEVDDDDHAQAATHFIRKATDTGRLSKLQQMLYNRDILQLGHALNRYIEIVLYDWPIRQQLSPAYAVTIVAMLAYLANALYSKFQPRNWLGVVLFKGLLIGMQLSIYGFSLIARLIFHSRQLWRGIPKVNIGDQI